ncbi:MAG: hypothetical protein HDR24_02850 [Lachnospiraceae bacterium]|nr:hypothetical protein [Lachnospiraceae bacterium]
MSGLVGMMLTGTISAAGRDPRSECETGVRDSDWMGTRMAYGYRYGVTQLAQKKNGFSFADFGKEVLEGAVTGGLASTAFYGAGKVFQALTGSVRNNKGATDSRNRIGNLVEPMDKTYEMALNPELYANEVADKYGINLKGSGQKISISYNPSLTSSGKTVATDPNIIELGSIAFASEEELANTIAHELNHARSFLKGGNAPEWGRGGAYPAGNALAEYIRGER